MASMFKDVKAVNQTYRTQKARGVKALADVGLYVPTFSVYGIEEFTNPIDEYGQICLFPSPDALANLIDRFVRPCPTVPRHGFVDSRPIRSIADAEKIIQETLAAEPNAELLTMPVVDAKYSAIWTHGKLVIGTGNDGATAGHTSRVIPSVGIPMLQEYQWQRALDAATVTESPYVELLWSKKYAYSEQYRTTFVQLRNGPSLPNTVDFIPEKITVTNVVIAEGDLLEWETKVKTFQAGTVVWHPGGSLASHYAVHAVLSKIPVLVSKEPKTGDVLEPVSEVCNPDIAKIKQGFLLGCNAELNFQTAAFIMLVGCHSTTAWLGKQDILLGFSLGCAYRLIITAALGEYRHQPGRKRRPSRNAVYSGVWKKILASSTRTRFVKSLFSFENDGWQGSYGGKKWLDFARYAALIFNALLDEDVTSALQNLNHAVHAAHNSGWAFDKFLNRANLDNTAKQPLTTMLDVAPQLYDAIIKSEDGTVSVSWFKHRKHFSLSFPEMIDKADESRARAKEKTEYENDPEKESHDCDCGSCACDECNSDGNNCSDHDCSYCFPSGCPYADSGNAHDCLQCHIIDCGDEDCSACHPQTEEPEELGAIDFVQVKIVLGSTDSEAKLHLQYTHENSPTVDGKKVYKTKNVSLTNWVSTYTNKLLKTWKEGNVSQYAPLGHSLSGSGTAYIVLEKSEYGDGHFWKLTYADKNDGSADAYNNHILISMKDGQ